MREYLRTANLLQATMLAAAVTLFSVGRLRQGELPLVTGIVMLFFSMTLVCAAVTAWGSKAGMPGIWTDRRTLCRGLLAATALGLMLWPVFLLVLDPPTRGVLGGAANSDVLRLAFPPTTGSRVALILWVAGFQTLFLQAAPMSLVARLSGSRLVAIGLCLLCRIYLTHCQVIEHGLADHMTLFLVPSATVGVIGCLLFARFGLAPAMFFGAMLNMRLLLP